MADDQTAEQLIEEWAAAVADLYENVTIPPDPFDERTANEAAANLMSSHGGFLDAPTAMARLITQAIGIGYLTALRDIRDGRTEL